MALSLNTSHPLYSNLKMLIGVDEGDALVDLVTPSRTLTPDTSSPSAASFGTGAWGRHFRTGGQPYNPRGAALSPAFNPGNNTGTLVFVTHGLYGGNNDGNFWNGSPASIAAGNPVRIPSFTRQYGGNNFAAVIDQSGSINAVDTGVSATSTADHMFTVARNGETSHAVYVDAISIASGGLFGYNGTNAASLSITRLGGTSGYGYFDCELVWLAWFDIALTAGQVADLYNSLGASNAFGLVSSGAATNGTASGTPDTLDLIAPSATAVGTGSANGSASGSPSPASITAPAATATGTTAGSGIITTPALKNNTGTILASISGWTVNVYNASTGTLVVQKTGLTTSAGGVLTVTDAAIATGTTYAYEPVHATYGRRLPTGAAS